MGAAFTCCKAPAGNHDRDYEIARRGSPGRKGSAGGAAHHWAATAGATATSGSSGASPRSYLHQSSIGFYSVTDGHGSDAEDEWHDALSEVDLAEALEEWEEQQLHGHDASVDAAIHVLKGHGHLLPPALEAAASQQRAQDMTDLATAEQQLRMAAAVEGATRVHVATAGSAAAAAEGAAKLPMLERSRSQQLRQALQSDPRLGKLLAGAAALAQQGRVLAAHSLAVQAAEAAGASLGELAALPSDALAGVLPASSASLDVAQLAEEVQFVEQTLKALDDHSGWMVSRDDALKVFYRHQRGTTVHSLKFAAVFDHPVEHLLAIAHEFDLIPTWNKFSLAAIMLAEPSIFESYLYGAQWMMRPFKPMQGLLRARGFDLADEHRCLLVSLSDCTPEQLPEGSKPLPPEFAKRKLVNFSPGSCMKLRPLPAAPDGTPRTEGSLCLHLDPHIPFLPAFLLNFVLGVLAPYIFKQILRVLDSSFADKQGVYSQRIRAQPHLYGLLRQRLAEFEAELSPRGTPKGDNGGVMGQLAGQGGRERAGGKAAQQPRRHTSKGQPSGSP